MRVTSRLFRFLLLISLLSIAFIPQSNAHAAALIVESLADTRGSPSSCGVGDNCTLRQAINLANSAAGADTITFNLSGTVTLLSPLPYIISTMTIDGSGQSITLDGDNAYQILYVHSSGNLSLNELTIANGNASSGNGGGIYNAGMLAVTNTTFSGNAAWHGSGIYNNSTISTITNSTFSGNTAWHGGGIYNNSTISTISNNTFSGNQAFYGGGIYNNSTITNIANSTFSNNDSHGGGGGSGGGVYNNSTITTIANSTFSGNFSTIGGGIYNNRTITNIANTIIAISINFASAGINNCQGNAPSTSTNNLTDVSGCWSWAKTLDYAVDLGPLANNGGPTQTIALPGTAATNPAIDTGDTSTCANAPVSTVDQRGTARPQGWGCDIGAFELEFPLFLVTGISLFDGSPIVDGDIVGEDMDILVITFSKDVYDIASGHDTADVTSTANYLLEKNGVSIVPITFVAYNNGGGSGPFMAYILLNDSVSLGDGDYKLTVNGTSSIRSSSDGNRLDGDGDGVPGGDFEFSFSVVATSGGTASADTGTDGGVSGTDGPGLPETGFAPHVVTILPAQPAEKSYTELGELWLEIPQLGLKMPIVGVPVVEDEWDVTWLGENAGWLTGTAYPTLKGNTVITGHVWDAYNNPGLFVNLRQLKHGDQFSIHIDGKVYTYEVRTNIQVMADDLSVLDHSDTDTVTLLTCEGYNITNDSYLYRRAVQAVLVSIMSE